MAFVPGVTKGQVIRIVDNAIANSPGSGVNVNAIANQIAGQGLYVSNGDLTVDTRMIVESISSEQFGIAYSCTSPTTGYLYLDTAYVANSIAGSGLQVVNNRLTVTGGGGGGGGTVNVEALAGQGLYANTDFSSLDVKLGYNMQLDWMQRIMVNANAIAYELSSGNNFLETRMVPGGVTLDVDVNGIVQTINGTGLYVEDYFDMQQMRGGKRLAVNTNAISSGGGSVNAYSLAGEHLFAFDSQTLGVNTDSLVVDILDGYMGGGISKKIYKVLPYGVNGEYGIDVNVNALVDTDNYTTYVGRWWDPDAGNFIAANVNAIANALVGGWDQTLYFSQWDGKIKVNTNAIIGGGLMPGGMGMSGRIDVNSEALAGTALYSEYNPDRGLYTLNVNTNALSTGGSVDINSLVDAIDSPSIYSSSYGENNRLEVNVNTIIGAGLKYENIYNPGVGQAVDAISVNLLSIAQGLSNRGMAPYATYLFSQDYMGYYPMAVNVNALAEAMSSNTITSVYDGNKGNYVFDLNSSGIADSLYGDHLYSDINHRLSVNTNSIASSLSSNTLTSVYDWMSGNFVLGINANNIVGEGLYVDSNMGLYDKIGVNVNALSIPVNVNALASNNIGLGYDSMAGSYKLVVNTQYLAGNGLSTVYNNMSGGYDQIHVNGAVLAGDGLGYNGAELFIDPYLVLGNSFGSNGQLSLVHNDTTTSGMYVSVHYVPWTMTALAGIPITKTFAYGHGELLLRVTNGGSRSRVSKILYSKDNTGNVVFTEYGATSIGAELNFYVDIIEQYDLSTFYLTNNDSETLYIFAIETSMGGINLPSSAGGGGGK